MTTDNTRLPPGSTGLPLLGETLGFLENSFAFVETRIATHGPIFRTHILGRSAAVIVGPEACSRWIDLDTIAREGAMPPHVKELFGGESLPSLDGQKHLDRKREVLAGFTADALATYVAGLETTLDNTFAKWAELGETPMVPWLKRLAIEAICANTTGLAPGPVLDQLLADYDLIGPGFGALPIPIPGTAYSKAKDALSRILATFETLALEHEKSPRDDGLSRILSFVTPDGAKISIDEARRELYHVVIAGLIIWADFATAFTELTAHPEVRAKLDDEISRVAPTGPVTLSQLRSMPYLAQVVMEVKRLCSIVPVQFGRAKRAFELNGFTVPEGWTVLLGVRSGNLVREIYTDPERFDPERFSPERAEHKKHEHAFSPQGPGQPEGHRCAGVEYSSIFISLFLVHLLREYTWDLPEQDLGLRWNMIPPEPKDGLRLHIRRK